MQIYLPSEEVCVFPLWVCVLTGAFVLDGVSSESESESELEPESELEESDD
jgi:hypothetical protein